MEPTKKIGKLEAYSTVNKLHFTSFYDFP